MSEAATRIVIFAKAPVPGTVKTRLIPVLGELGAATLAEQMLSTTLGHARATGLAVELCTAPQPSDPSWNGHLPVGVRLSDQGQGDLGKRLAVAAKRVLHGGERILLIGTDCPQLDRVRLRKAADQLDRFDAVMHPAHDGGYVLLGLARMDLSIFEDIAWSTDSVAAATASRIRALGWSLWVGDTLQDIDVPADLDATLGHL